ncbi:MAG: MFS transporter [Desulfobulbaceae bacterium]|nr:MAG: MFS transporter [Desulfobulbaceae bacterium]
MKYRSPAANIYYLYLIRLSKWLMLIMPIVALFYNENGLSTFDIFLLQAVYSFSVAIFEIPSGYMADIIGRRTSLICGGILGTLGFAVLSISHDFSGFLIAELILGLGGSFISGSDSALLYDSLVVSRREHNYIRYEGRITALGNLAETAAAVGGGLIALWLGYRGVYVAQTMIAAIAIPSSLLLIEPARKKLTERPSFSQIIEISKHALFKDLKLSSTIILSAATGTATLTMAWTAQIYFVAHGFTEVQITPLWVLLNLCVAVVSASTALVVRKIGTRKAILLIFVVMPLSYILMGILPIVPALIVLTLFYLVRGYATPLLRNLTNLNCESEIRATVLSIRSLLVRVCFTVGGPAIGYLAGKYTLDYALIIFGVVLWLMFAFGVVFLFRYHRDSLNSYS